MEALLNVVARIKKNFFHVNQERSLLDAIRNGDKGATRVLLNDGGDANSGDDFGSALMHAANCGHVEIAHTLLIRGADPNAMNRNGSTALIYAAERGSADIVNLLLRNNADTDARQKDGTTVLIFAAILGHVGIVKTLIDCGADLSARESQYGRTCLGWAIQQGHTEIVQLLKEAGAKE